LADRRAITEAGFGLLDVLLALVVLLVVIIPATYLIDTTVQQSASARSKVAATELAEQELEALNNSTLATLEGFLNTTTTVGTQSVSNVTYTTSVYLDWKGTGASPNLCSAGTPPQSMSANATVSWGTATTQQVTEESVIDPPYNQPGFNISGGTTTSGKTTSGLVSGDAYSSLTATTAQTIASGSSLTIGAGTSENQSVTTSLADSGMTTISVATFTANSTYPSDTAVALPDEGYLGVQLDGVSGSAPTSVNQVTVSIQQYSASSPNPNPSSTYTPDANGCVYAEELPGTYVVRLSSSTSPPFVDTYENATPQSGQDGISNPVVTAGSTTIVTFNYNQSGKVNFAPAGSVPIATGLPVSIANTSEGSTGTDLGVIASGSTSTYAYLYPFTSSYSIWYGDCTDEQPSTPLSVTVNGGATTSASITGLADVAVDPVTAAGANDAGFTSTVTVNDCDSDTWSLPGTSSSASPNLEAAVVLDTRTDSTGITTTNGSATVKDSSIASTDAGKLVTGSGIPANSYVGTVTAGTSFTLVSQPGGSTAVKATGASSYLVLQGETYSVAVTNGSTSNSASPAKFVVVPAGVWCQSGCSGTTYQASGTALKVIV
jgi:Tfp pilus assembly protein PilV